jgi:hypothetical protein
MSSLYMDQRYFAKRHCIVQLLINSTTLKAPVCVCGGGGVALVQEIISDLNHT